jgi:hypothetical protein
MNKGAEMKYRKKIIVLILITQFNSFPRVPRQVWRIIHGTFAKQAIWYQPGGDFYEALKKILPDDAIIRPFAWSGKNRDEERYNAAHQLIMDITAHDRIDDERYLIAHSHGCNVGMIAIQELAKRNINYKINSFFTLAPPICRSSYQPEMSHLKNLYNFFSFGDRIQPVFQTFYRTYEEHPNIWNIEITLNNQHPDHGSMHHPAIAKLLPHIHNQPLANEQSLIHFYSDKNPELEIDMQREKKLEDDKHYTEHMISAMQFMRTYTPNKAIRYYAQEYHRNFTQLASQNWNIRLRSRRDINPEDATFFEDIADHLRSGYSIPSLWREKLPISKEPGKDSDATFNKSRD